MKGTIKIAKIADIPILLHWSFGLLGAYVVYNGHDLESMLWLGALVLAMFVCVVMHEYGHALSARYYGINTHDIILLPIGGVARLERLPEKPWQEVVVTFAGPLVNLVIAILLLPYFFFDTGFNVDYANDITNPVNFIPLLCLLNIGLALFNLLPAFPMDGGRILRAFLAMKFGRIRATRMAAYVGQFFAIGFIAFALFASHYMMVLLGIAVFLLATVENNQIQTEALLSESKVAEVFCPKFTSYVMTDKMNLPIDQMLGGVEKSFLIFDTWRQNIIGVLPEELIKKAIANNAREAYAGDYFSAQFRRIHPTDSLKKIYDLMQYEGHVIFPVYDENELLGVFDVSMMNKFIHDKRKKK